MEEPAPSETKEEIAPSSNYSVDLSPPTGKEEMTVSL
jgi:hypothetical protein